MIGKLNHVGVATPSIEASVKMYREMLGATRLLRDLRHAGAGRLGLFRQPAQQPDRADRALSATKSPITAFLEKNPKGGQHHVCFEVPDIIAARDEMRAKGATVLGTGEPRIGAHGVPVIFVHPKDMGGVLVELMAEPPQGRAH